MFKSSSPKKAVGGIPPVQPRIEEEGLLDDAGALACYRLLQALQPVLAKYAPALAQQGQKAQPAFDYYAFHGDIHKVLQDMQHSHDLYHCYGHYSHFTSPEIQLLFSCRVNQFFSARTGDEKETALTNLMNLAKYQKGKELESDYRSLLQLYRPPYTLGKDESQKERLREDKQFFRRATLFCQDVAARPSVAVLLDARPLLVTPQRDALSIATARTRDKDAGKEAMEKPVRRRYCSGGPDTGIS